MGLKNRMRTLEINVTAFVARSSRQVGLIQKLANMNSEQADKLEQRVGELEDKISGAEGEGKDWLDARLETIESKLIGTIRKKTREDKAADQLEMRIAILEEILRKKTRKGETAAERS